MRVLAVAVVLAAAKQVAAEDVPGGLGVLAQYGALGVIAALLVVFARTAIKRDADRSEAAWRREVERADRLEAEVNRLNNSIQEKAIPALLAGATAINECTQMLREMQRQRRDDYSRRDDREPR